MAVMMIRFPSRDISQNLWVFVSKLTSTVCRFLTNLSLLDVLLTSMVIPMVSNQETSSFPCYHAQAYFNFLMDCMEFFLFRIMSLDFQMAISYLLQYVTIMSNRICLWLVAASWQGVTFAKPLLWQGSISKNALVTQARFLKPSHSVLRKKMSNQTTVTEFLLLGFSDVPELQILHFIVFLLLYLISLLGNLLIITAIALDCHLHNPMYFFLMNLSILDFSYISVTIPKSMANSLMNTRSISYSGCVAQVFFFLFFASANFVLLTIMAYDRYIAICQPLHYEMVMTRRACVQMAASAWNLWVFFSKLTSPVCPFITNLSLLDVLLTNKVIPIVGNQDMSSFPSYSAQAYFLMDCMEFFLFDVMS
ncbi:unnamed protein product [Caretta caretta]